MLQLVQVYSVSVSPFFGVQAPGPSPQLHGDVGINFSCSPANTHHLIQAAVDEVSRLQARCLLQMSFPKHMKPSAQQPKSVSTFAEQFQHACRCSGGSTLLQRLAVGAMLPHFLPMMVVAHVFMCGLCLVA